MDVHEDKEKNLVTATFELPGINKQDVNIDMRNNILTVSGESRFSQERDEKGYLVRERRFGRFSRSLPLPEGVKVCKICVRWTHRHGPNHQQKARGDQGSDG